MARITDAELSASGSQADAVLTVRLRLDWDRRDRDRRFEITVRVVGDDTGLRGRDDTLLLRSVPAAPDIGTEMEITIGNHDRVLDEDRGDDEVYAECELRELREDRPVVRTNTVSGVF